MPNLSNSDKKLAEFILDKPDQIRDLSSKELAQSVGISQSSVVKFAQKLKFKGYPDLKFAIIDDIQNTENVKVPVHGSIAIDDDINLVAEKLVQSKVKVLQQTKQLNDHHKILSCVKLLHHANRVMISGIGGSALVGKDFTLKLQKLGINAVSEYDHHAQIAFAATMSDSDVLFAISETGSTQEIVKITNQAKFQGAKIVSLTKFGNNAIANQADLRLYSVAEDSTNRISSILARTAQEFVIDMLFIVLMQKFPQRRQLLEKTRDAATTFRFQK